MRINSSFGRRVAVFAAMILLLAVFAAYPWLLTNIFSTNYLPHGLSFLWNPRLLWLNAVSDTVIWLSYTAIALTLISMVRVSRRQIQSEVVFFLLGAFIVACGFTHFMNVVVLWKPLYWLSGDLKLLTACASLIAAGALPFYAPHIKATLYRAAASAENERRFLAAMNSSLDSFYILQSIRDSSGEIIDFRFSFVNRVGARLLNREPDQMIGQAMCELIPGNRTAGFFDRYKRVVESGEPLVDEFPMDFPDMNATWLKFQVIKLDDGVAITTSDISDRKILEFERTRAFTESLIASSPAAIIVTNLDYTISAINPAAEKMLWYRSDEMIGVKTPLDFYDRAEVELLAQRLSAESGDLVSMHQAIFFAGKDRLIEHEGEWTFIRNGGSSVIVQVTVTPLKNGHGQATGFMITAYDISERKQREEYVAHAANHDGLTGLPTRQLLMDRLDMMLARSERYVTRSALLMIDLNNFKHVNDSLGHSAGDKLLVQVGERLRSTIRSVDTVARMGGDEFVVLLSELDTPAVAENVAEKILAAFKAPFAVNDQSTLDVTASIGVCVFPDGGADAAALIRNADVAMYHAKAAGGNCCQVFTKEIADFALQQREVETALRGALEAREFELHYQPQYSLADGRMVGVEALLRWNSKRLGSVAPSRFIHLAEQSGLILPIGAWVIRTACEELRRLQDRFGKTFLMGVNLSARQLDQLDLLQVIENALVENDLDPTSLEIEITESMLMTDSPSATVFFDGLRRLGVRVAIDDFGTGFSSMSYLIRFPVDRLKIDRCFIQDCSTNPSSAAVTGAIIALAHQLKLLVVAEGVELEEQMDFLKSAGCDDVQGFHLCRPLSAAMLSSVVSA